MSSENRAQASTRGRLPRVLYPILWSLFIALLVAGPWLLPGYIFGTDWPGPRRFMFPTEATSSAPLEIVFALGSGLVSGEVIGKVFVLGVLFIAPLTAFHAVPAPGFVPRAAGATVYALNPFVYGRLHYGQLFLLAAYAVLPLAALSLRRLLMKPGPVPASGAAIAAAITGMFSPHVFLMAALLSAVLLVTHLGGLLRDKARIRHVSWLMSAGGAALALSAYWIIPLITGRGNSGGFISATGPAAITAYAARPDSTLGLIPNLLGLYGFWAEDVGRFTSMKAFVPGWPIGLVLLLLVCALGAAVTLRQRGNPLKPWVTGLLLAGAMALVLEMGVSQAQTAEIVTWLDAHFVLYRGMRDAGKWAALLALLYSQLAAVGASAILSWARRAMSNPIRTEWAGGVAAALMLALPLYYGNGLLFGVHGEIKPSRYPAGWYAADRALHSDGQSPRSLFLPWHEYMRYSFIENENKIVASPAPSFFSVPVVASQDPEIPGIAPPNTPDQVAVSALVSAGAKGNWSSVLASRGIKYVLVAKELDWGSYNYLDNEPGFVKAADFGTILLYRNIALPP